MSASTGVVTLIVVAGGTEGRRIAELAMEQAAFDPIHRRVVHIVGWIDAPAVAVIVVSEDGEVRGVLSAQQANSAPWIEDAFVCARRARSKDSISCGIAPNRGRVSSRW